MLVDKSLLTVLSTNLAIGQSTLKPISVSRFGCVHNCCWNSARLSSKNCCCAECNRCQRRMEPMSMERNVTTTYEYSNAFPFEKAFDQWHYKRWTEDNWVRILLKKGHQGHQVGGPSGILTLSFTPFGYPCI